MEEFNNMKKKWSPKRPKTGKHAKKVVAIVAGVAVVGLFATDCTYQIQEQEQAVLSTFGVPKAVTETGLHFKLPLIQQVHKAVSYTHLLTSSLPICKIRSFEPFPFIIILYVVKSIWERVSEHSSDVYKRQVRYRAACPRDGGSP